MNVLFVGGNFDDEGGKPSSVVNKFYSCLIDNNNIDNVTLFNGGYYNELKKILNSCVNYDVVFWWANVPNNKPKIRNVKKINPKTLLVTSKRNNNSEYSFADLINKALLVKANLCIEFSKETECFKMMIFDPLGNSWYNGTDISKCCNIMIDRLMFLKSITRQSTTNIPNDNDIIVPDDIEFFNIVKQYAEVFHALINPAKDVTRFLGNSSFRCQRGFPSFKKDGVVYVSCRNVDKRFISKENFVPTIYKNGEIYYYGDNKPSVDTPIQLRLYNTLPNINYMIHAHVYIDGAPFTSNMIPCGGIEEVDEIMSVIKNNFSSLNENFYVINLIGHGCIVMSSDVEKLKKLKYIGRNAPEFM